MYIKWQEYAVVDKKNKNQLYHEVLVVCKSRYVIVISNTTFS